MFEILERLQSELDQYSSRISHHQSSVAKVTADLIKAVTSVKIVLSIDRDGIDNIVRLLFLCAERWRY